MTQRSKTKEEQEGIFSGLCWVYPLAEACPLVEARDSGGNVRPWGRRWAWEVGSLNKPPVHFSRMATREKTPNWKPWDLSAEPLYSDLRDFMTWGQRRDMTKLDLSTKLGV